MLLLLSLPPGPDICDLLGVCHSASGLSTGNNLLYLATSLMLAGIVVHRSGKKR